MDYKRAWEELSEKVSKAERYIAEMYKENHKNGSEDSLRLRGKYDGIRLVGGYLRDIERLIK